MTYRDAVFELDGLVCRFDSAISALNVIHECASAELAPETEIANAIFCVYDFLSLLKDHMNNSITQAVAYEREQKEKQNRSGVTST